MLLQKRIVMLFKIRKQSTFLLNKNWVASLMGSDVESFSDKDLEDAINYLLPSGLFDKTSRPILKHEQYYDKYKNFTENKFDTNNFPPTLYSKDKLYHDLIFKIYKLEMKNTKDNLRTFKSSDEKESIEHYRWITKNEFDKYFKSSFKLSDGQYKFLIHKLTNLIQFQKDQDVYTLLRNFIVPLKVSSEGFCKLPIDSNGVVNSMGYRKSSMADIQLRLGTGTITVNNIPFEEYFTEFFTRSKILMPFQIIKKLDIYDVDAQVHEGGIAGQADAMRLAISLALPSFSEDYIQPLASAGLLNKDPRLSERKKFGQEGARKKYAWVAR